MKTINLRGIMTSLSDSEMKMVKGGQPEQIKEAPTPGQEQTAEEAACNNKVIWQTCKLGTSSGDASGQCVDKSGNGKLSCRL